MSSSPAAMRAPSPRQLPTALLRLVSFPAFSAQVPASTIVFSPKELDFGIQTSTSPPATRIITVSNLGGSSQTFTSALDATSSTASPFAETSSDCTLAGASTSKLLAPGGTCHITLALTAYTSSSDDGVLQANWSIGARDVLLTGYSQAAALSVSASEINFGTQYASGLRLPRYLYLSNPSAHSIAHAALGLAASSPFTLTDACPSILLPRTVCRIRIDYLSSATISDDVATLDLDDGLTVLLTGQTLPVQTAGGTSANPNLSLTPASVAFADPVVVTSVSATSEILSIANTGTSPIALALSTLGDFSYVTSCPASLPAAQTCAVSLSFAPSQPGLRQGLLSITSDAGTSPAYVPLSGTGAAIVPANNGILDFGSDPIGQPESLFYKIAMPFPALSASTSGPWSVALAEDSGFGHGEPFASSYTNSLTSTCHNCYLALRFLPPSAGPQTGTLTLSSTIGGSPYVLSLTGSGMPVTGLTLTPATKDFGDTPVNSVSAPVLFTLTNLIPAQASVLVNTPAITGDFTAVPLPSGGEPCGGTLTYTASCFVQVAFTPAATGARTGALSLTTSAGPVTAVLAGTGSADPGIAFNPTSLAFNNVAGATATQQTITLTNTSPTPLLIGAPTTGTAAMQPASACATLVPGASCTLSVTFQPGTALVQDTLSIPVSNGSVTTTYTVPLTGAYLASTRGLSILPALAVYGPTAVLSQGPTHQFTLANFSSQSLSLTLDVPRDFVLVDPPCAALPPNSTCTFSLASLPLTNGDIPGTVHVQGYPADGSAPSQPPAISKAMALGKTH